MTDQAVAQLAYDRTVEALVVDTEKKVEGIYSVQYDQYTFEAYARQGEAYYENDVVLVQVPQNDFNNQKYILGRKQNKDAQNKAYNFKFPFDDFVLFGSVNGQATVSFMNYKANNPFHGNIWTDDEMAHNRLVWAYENNGANNLFGTKLGIKVDVQTLLVPYNAKEGSFGFQIILKGMYINEDGFTEPARVSEFYFTDKNMYGNPYAYMAPTEQQIILDVSKYKRIDAIYIAFWQDFKKDTVNNFEGSFKNAYGELIEWDDGSPANIIFTDLEVYSGISVDEVNTDTLYIYTYDNLTYGSASTLPGEREAYDSRVLHAAWVNYDSETKSGELIDSYSDLLKYNAHLYWYIHDSNWTPDSTEYDSTLPSHRFGGLFWRPMPELEDKCDVIVVPEIGRSNTRYKAVLHHDGTYITSETIRFNNAVDVEGLAEDIARNDTYILKCATYKVDKDLGTETLVADDAIGNFYAYDENNNILTTDDNKLYSDVVYYIEIWAKTITENGDTAYVRLSDYVDDDGSYAPYQVEWQPPENQTMITNFRVITAGEAYFSQRTDEQFTRDCASTRAFQISRTYNMRYSDNDITAVIQRNGQTFTIKKHFQFGRAMALGCEYTPVINIESPEGNYYIDTNSTYEISCSVYDRRGQLIEETARPECTFEWKIYGGRNKPTYYYVENAYGFIGNVLKGRQSICEPFIVEVTVNNAGDYPLTVRRGIMISNNSLFMQEHDIACPDRIEFRSDGQSPKYYHNPFTVQTLNLGERNKFLYPTWYLNNDKFLKLIEVEQKNQSYITSTGDKIDSGGTHTSYALGFKGNKVMGEALREGNYAQQWTDALLSDEYFSYIYFTYGTTTVAQAIAFDRNVYSSSLVNEWDGQSLSLDYENSAVIAKMIAAGSKDKKNRFTGVMMGDWHEKGDESLDMTGLYGLSLGAQTFAFKQDGTGFIGPSGKGRIHFDGRNALISNSDNSCYLNLNPVMVDRYLDEEGKTDEEIWDLADESGFSQFFLYCKVPQKTETDDAWKIATFDEETGEYIDTTWAKSFIDPEEGSEEYGYDFFLVDPNYGVVTSGGIYAKFGVLGKKYPWIISDSGLTQKNFYGTIFLGNPEYVRDSERFHYNHISSIEPTYTMDGEEVLENGMYSMIFTDKSDRVHTALRTDGYLFTEYATIGNWYINDYEIYLPKTEKAFRKFYQKVVSEFDDRPTYCLDTINLNAKDGVLAFNEGHMLIDGKNGLMGFDKENHFTKDKYTMMMDFSKGLINFAKLSAEDDPHAQIDGTNGIAYFAKKNIIISGKDAVMYIGSPVKVNGVAPTEQKQGTIYLAQIKIWGLSANDAGADANISLPSVSIGGSGSYSLSSTTILPFEFQLSEDESAINGGVLELWQPENYNTISYSQSGGGTINSAGVCYVGYVRDQFTIEDTRTSLVGGGLNIGVGGNGVILQPAGAAGTEGYLAGNWHLSAKDIKADTVIMDEGYIKDGANYVAIASQYWVYNSVANPLWSSIVQVNNLAAEALKKAGEGIYKANKALGQAVVGATAEGFSTSITYDITFTRKNGESFTAGPFLGQHSHTIKFSESGGSITLTMSDVGPKGQTASFNMAATQWYKDRLAAIYLKSETVPGGIGVSVQQTGESGGSGSAVGTAGSNSTQISATLDADGKKVTVSSSLGGQFDVALADFYTTAYNAGWAAAAAGCGRSGNTVTYPTSTVGQKASATAHHSDTHSAGVSKTYKTVTEADVGTQVIASASGVLYGTSHFYWT